MGCPSRVSPCIAAAAAACAVLLSAPAPAAGWPMPPLYKVSGETYYDVGLQLGTLARERIRGWLETEELRGLINRTRGPASAAAFFNNLKDVNTRAFPEYADEIQGLADGVGVPVEHVWVANLISEIEGYHGTDVFNRAPGEGWDGHCSDMYVGNAAHGHNEDWSDAARPLWYLAELTFPDHTCKGFGYPGVLLGFSATWGEKLYATQNSLYPKAAGVGLAAGLMQRKAVCGAAQRTAKDAVASLANLGAWGLGASVNIIELDSGNMTSFEAHQGDHTIHAIPHGGNWTHFNKYKIPPFAGIDIPAKLASSEHRQARADQLPAPKTKEDIMAFLSDTHDSDLPVYRPNTLATFILDVPARIVRAWVNRPSINGTWDFEWQV